MILPLVARGSSFRRKIIIN